MASHAAHAARPHRGTCRLLNSSLTRYCRNVKRWGDGQMVMRWVASALSDAALRMRKLRGCSQMRALLEALDTRRAKADDATVRKAA